MSTATTTRSSSSTPWCSPPPSRNLPMPSTTPHGLPPRMPASAGQPMPPGLSAKSRSPRTSRDPRITTPSYFEFVVDPNSNPTDSNAGGHAKKNWSPGPTRFHQLAGTSPRSHPVESHPNFEAFRRQSQNSSFSLSHGNLSHFSSNPGVGQSPTSEVGTGDGLREGATSPQSRTISASHVDSQSATQTSNLLDRSSTDETPSFFDMPRIQSPSQTSALEPTQMHPGHVSHLDERHRPNSLPHAAVDPPSPGALSHLLRRAETLPSSLASDTPTMISPQELVDVIKNHLSQDVLLLDLRVYPQFSQSRISGAINLCIPTTLLKRPSFNVQKLAETFTKAQEKEKFSRWRQAKAIVVYDTGSSQLRDATSSVNTLKKFVNEGWHGSTLVLRGGFAGFSKKHPGMIDKRTASEMEGSGPRKLAIDPQMPLTAPVAGGCVMPSAKTSANPFFGNIRQNMDLIGGVGQIAIKLPSSLGLSGKADLPVWLRRVSDATDQGKNVADQFLGIEKAEQQRMQKALSANVCYGAPNITSSENIQIAGIEKGAKNRYNDMLPYDHSRVRLQNVPSGGCDYVNASHVRSRGSYRQYIATQAPVPNTFQDFWRITWEQDARVIVMLTAEFEGGQRKCHPYWLPGEYGPFKLKSLSERKLCLDIPKRASTNGFTPSSQNPSTKRPGMDRRRSTNNSLGQKDFPLSQTGVLSPESEIPHVIVRKIALSHAAYPFEPMREITQLQYSSWPDLGTPTHPAHVLGLVEHCVAVISSYDIGNGKGRGSADAPASKGDRPIVVHCSAGCGRTGTFCTVDSVIDKLKRQRLHGSRARTEEETNDDDDGDEAMKMDVDGEEPNEAEDSRWIPKEDVDLVAETVKDFRLQRLSMVQTLRQFVLCYESVLEWVIKESPNCIATAASGARRSYHA